MPNENAVRGDKADGATQSSGARNMFRRKFPSPSFSTKFHRAGGKIEIFLVRSGALSLKLAHRKIFLHERAKKNLFESTFANATLFYVAKSAERVTKWDRIIQKG